jgi:NhaP-type Na+/H+ or K+/H+ antiporter
MALSLPAELPERALLVAITFGVVLFTLVVQSRSAWLIRRTGVGADGA